MLLMIFLYNKSDYDLLYKRAQFQHMLKYDMTFFNMEKNDPEAYFILGIIKDIPPVVNVDVNNPNSNIQPINVESGIVINNYNTVNNQTIELNSTNQINNRLSCNETNLKIDAELINITGNQNNQNIQSNQTNRTNKAILKNVVPSQVGAGGNDSKKTSIDYSSEFNNSNNTSMVIGGNPFYNNLDNSNKTENVFESALIKYASNKLIPRVSVELDFKDIDISNFDDQTKPSSNKHNKHNNARVSTHKINNNIYNSDNNQLKRSSERKKSISSRSLFKTPFSQNNFVGDSRFKSSSILKVRPKKSLEVNLSSFFEKNPDLTKSSKKISSTTTKVIPGGKFFSDHHLNRVNLDKSKMQQSSKRFMNTINEDKSVNSFSDSFSKSFNSNEISSVQSIPEVEGDKSSIYQVDDIDHITITNPLNNIQIIEENEYYNEDSGIFDKIGKTGYLKKLDNNTLRLSNQAPIKKNSKNMI